MSDKIQSIQVAPAYETPDGVSAQFASGPDDKTQFWAVYERDAEGMAWHVEDFDNPQNPKDLTDARAKAEAFGRELAAKHRVSVEPYGWPEPTPQPVAQARPQEAAATVATPTVSMAATATPAPAPVRPHRVVAPMDHKALDEIELEVRRICRDLGMRAEFDRSGKSPAAEKSGVDDGARVARLKITKPELNGLARVVHSQEAPAANAASLLAQGATVAAAKAKAEQAAKLAPAKRSALSWTPTRREREEMERAREEERVFRGANADRDRIAASLPAAYKLLHDLALSLANHSAKPSPTSAPATPAASLETAGNTPAPRAKRRAGPR